jgi:ribosomal protein S12 methylthiotransferase accessory factor
VALYRYGSSLRAAPLEVTLAHARELARARGVARVTDTTRLDRIGIPVFAAIRPGAARGSLCVSAGKGLTLDEARAGATMEAIELSFAEPGRSSVAVRRARARDVLGGAIEDLAPVRPVPPDAELDCVEATDLRTGEPALVPAEVVFFPWPAGERYFGSDGNGLASGNTLEEATLHGLAEVIERDVTSFGAVRDDSRLVRNATLPPPLDEVAAHLDRIGFDLHVRHTPNAFGLAHFLAVVVERGVPEGVHRGDALHPSAAIAATRAVTEAIQCRLTVIHGGRDDLRRHFQPFEAMGEERKADLLGRLAACMGHDPSPIDFAEVPDHAARAADIPAATALLVDALERNGFRRILRVVYTPPDLPLQVVRILVPGLECLVGLVNRVGRRLKDFHAQALSGLRRPDPA